MIYNRRYRPIFIIFHVGLVFIFGILLVKDSNGQTLLPATGNDTSDIAWLGLQAPGSADNVSFSSIVTINGSSLRIQDYNGKVVGDGSEIELPLTFRNTNGVVLSNVDINTRVTITGSIRFEDSSLRNITVGPSRGNHAGLLFPNGELGRFGSQRLELKNTTVENSVRLFFVPDLLVLNNSAVDGSVDLGQGNDVLVLEGENRWGQTITLKNGDDWVIDRGGLLSNAINGGNEEPLSVPIAEYGDAYLYFGVKKVHQNSLVQRFERFSLVYGSDIDFSQDNALSFNFIYVDPTSTAQFGNHTEISLANDGANSFAKSLFSNDGTISLQNKSANDRLRVNGDYTSSGSGKLLLDTNINEGQSDVLEITDNTSGHTQVEFQNTGGSIDPFTPVKILVVEVGGKSDGVFTTSGVQGTAYEYQLVKESNGNWYLQNVFQDGLPTVNAGVPSVLGALSTSSFAAESGLSVFRNRMESIRTNSKNTGGCCRHLFGLGWCGDSESCQSRQANFWYQNHYSDLNSRLCSGLAFDSDRNETFFGSDWIDHKNSFYSGSIAVGVFGKFGNGEFDFNGRGKNFSASSTESGIKSTGIGTYVSLFDEVAYADLVIQYQRDQFYGDSLQDIGTETFLASFSCGYGWLKSRQWTLSPEGRILVSNTEVAGLDSSFQGTFDPTVEDFDSIVGQVGLRVDRDWRRYGVIWSGMTRVAYQHEFLGDTSIVIGNLNERVDYSGGRFSLQMGLKGNLGRHLSLQSQVGAIWASRVRSFGAGLGVAYHR